MRCNVINHKDTHCAAAPKPEAASVWEEHTLWQSRTTPSTSDSSVLWCPAERQKQSRRGGRIKDEDGQETHRQTETECIVGGTHQLHRPIVFPAEVSTPAAQVLRGRAATQTHSHTHGRLRLLHHTHINCCVCFYVMSLFPFSLS